MTRFSENYDLLQKLNKSDLSGYAQNSRYFRPIYLNIYRATQSSDEILRNVLSETFRKIKNLKKPVFSAVLSLF